MTGNVDASLGRLVYTAVRSQGSRSEEGDAQGRIRREETFEQVEALVKQGKSKTDAFAQVASDTGRNTGTVSANYYRVARANGVVKPRRRRRASTTATSRTPRTRTPRTTPRRGPVASTASPPISLSR